LEGEDLLAGESKSLSALQKRERVVAQLFKIKESGGGGGS